MMVSSVRPARARRSPGGCSAARRRLRIRSRRHAGSRQGRDGPIYDILTVAAVFVACVTSAPAGTWMSPPLTRAPARSPTGPRTMARATLAPAAPPLILEGV